ncbi:unnamed protein product [Rotaria sordida]|uniref:Uncharacterized protein n=1 Tax=Rotaria sordida TaxID=392033 RepID=A0A815RM11_9BILA|nr:unnamed protein product [Rotaria sordida]CAF1647226.1 unnamed protein product [Rotaria sordida]
MPWLNEIEVKTCVTYTSRVTNQLLTTNLNSMCLTDRQIELLSKVKNILKIEYNPHRNKLILFIHIPPGQFGEAIPSESADFNNEQSGSETENDESQTSDADDEIDLEDLKLTEDSTRKS